MTPLPSPLGPLGQIALTVQDLPRATAFYKETLGLPLLFEVPGLAFFNLHGIRLMLSRGEGEPKEPHGTVLYFKTDDLQGGFSTLKDRGVAALGEPHLIAKMPDHELWMAFFRDSEGNAFALMSEVRK
jgi:methylmalonyl-CoA/ethylmalonyl-CoA epimerase